MGSRIHPVIEMDSIQIARLPELQDHLSELMGNDAIPINAKLVDHVQLQLNSYNARPFLPVLLPSLSTIITATEQDPTPLITLASKLVDYLDFEAAIKVVDPPSLTLALQSPLPAFQNLALVIINKATESLSSIDILADLPEVVVEVVKTWVTTKNTSTSNRAELVLVEMLTMDTPVESDEEREEETRLAQDPNAPPQQPPPGRARIWNLITNSKSTLGAIVTACTASEPRSAQDASISQGRLLSLISRIAPLRLECVAETRFPELLHMDESVVSRIGHGLLQWAALEMIDVSDQLMHLTLIDFFENLLLSMSTSIRCEWDERLMKSLVKEACRDDQLLKTVLRALPKRIESKEDAEDGAEALQEFISEIQE